MPSPRRPIRSMASRSTMHATEQVFAIAVAAQERAGDDAEHAPAERRDRVGHLGLDGGMYLHIADDALLAMRAASLELRLDERDEPRRRPCQRQRRRQH